MNSHTISTYGEIYLQSARAYNIMADSCPEGSENRTDCLLQAILNASSTSDYNWDPLTFAFTAAIGLLALVVAMVTVFQGLLSAGPGRVKASRHAIGNFAVKSKSRFDLFEMAIRTKAMVPFFSWSMFVTELAQMAGRKEPLALIRDKEGIKDHSATWLSIMGRLKLDNAKFWEKSLIERATDYLPSDIYAAPAAAEARCLALLVVLADDHCEIVVNDRYVEVRGATSQLSFRDHPVAGKVAAFDDFCISTTRSGMKPSGTTPPDADVWPLLIGCELMDGMVRSTDREPVNLIKPHRSTLAKMWQPFGEDDGCDHSWCSEVRKLVHTNEVTNCQHKPLRELMITAIALCTYPAPLWARGFPSQRLRVEDILDMIWETTPGWKTDAEAVIDLFKDAEKVYGFPTPMRKYYDFWMEKGRHIIHTRTSQTAEAWWAAKRGNQFNTQEAPWRRIHNPHGGCISEDILTSVNQWMLDVGDPSEVDAVDIVMREYVLHQLQDLCTWMEDQPGVPWRCATRAILYRIWRREYNDLEQIIPDAMSPMSALNPVVPAVAQPIRPAEDQQRRQPAQNRVNSISSVNTTTNGIMTRQIASVTSLNQLVNEPVLTMPRRVQTEPMLAQAPQINTSDSRAMDGIQAMVAYRALLYGIFLMLNTDTSVFADMSGAGHVEAIVKVL